MKHPSFTCLVIDDEPLARGILEKYISLAPSLSLKASCHNAMEAYEVLSNQPIDVMFCDIDMPEINGLELVRSLVNRPQVILTTAYPQYALEGFELDVVDYLTKPIPLDRFLKAVQKLKNREAEKVEPVKVVQPETPTEIFVKEDIKLVRLQLADIVYIEGMKDYVKIHLAGGKFIVTHTTMKKIEEAFPGENFIRVQKSYIINKSMIRSLVGNTLELLGNARITVGGQFRENLLRALEKGIMIK